MNIKSFITILCLTILTYILPITSTLNAGGREHKMKTLIVYYSLTGNTEAVAKELSKELNADLRKVEDLKKHATPWYYSVGCFSAIKNKQWDIKSVDFSLNGYDRIFVGSPVWANNPVPAINTFIANADFTGKDVILFVTLGGKTSEPCIKNMSEKITQKGGKIIGSFAIQAGKKPEDIIPKTTEIAKQYKK
jgi:flavodoxin